MNELIDNLIVEDNEIKLPRYRVSDGVLRKYAYEEKQIDERILEIAGTHFAFRDIVTEPLAPSPQLSSLIARIDVEKTNSAEAIKTYLRENCAEYDKTAPPNARADYNVDFSVLSAEEKHRLHEANQRIQLCWLEAINQKCRQAEEEAIAAYFAEHPEEAEREAQPEQAPAAAVEAAAPPRPAPPEVSVEEMRETLKQKFGLE